MGYLFWNQIAASNSNIVIFDENYRHRKDPGWQPLVVQERLGELTPLDQPNFNTRELNSITPTDTIHCELHAFGVSSDACPFGVQPNISRIGTN